MSSSMPRVRVRSKGRITSTLDSYVEMYRAKYPDRAVRYVYDPEHKPELSAVLSRQAMGYRIVTMGELDLGGEKDKPVRVADLVLMSVEQKLAEEERKELMDRATEERLRVDRQFRDQVEADTEAVQRDKGGRYSRPLMKPVGGAEVEERTFEYEIDPNERKEDG